MSGLVSLIDPLASDLILLLLGGGVGPGGLSGLVEGLLELLVSLLLLLQSFWNWSPYGQGENLLLLHFPYFELKVYLSILSEFISKS